VRERTTLRIYFKHFRRPMNVAGAELGSRLCAAPTEIAKVPYCKVTVVCVSTSSAPSLTPPLKCSAVFLRAEYYRIFGGFPLVVKNKGLFLAAK
jgi:hypothetical protein